MVPEISRAGSPNSCGQVCTALDLVSPAMTARYPGSSVVMATSCCATACGKAPTTSARPPVLISGTASDAIDNTVIVMLSGPLHLQHFASTFGGKLLNHGLCNQAYAVFGAAEPFGIQFRVLPDDQAFGDAHA